MIDVGLVPAGGLDPLDAVFGRENFIARDLEPGLEQPDEIGLVVDDQDAFLCHGLPHPPDNGFDDIEQVLGLDGLGDEALDPELLDFFFEHPGPRAGRT